MTLDLAVARAVFRARQIERAANDSGPWTVVYGNQSAPAVRWCGEDRVTFRAHFPNACWLEDSDPVVTLLCHGEFVGEQVIDVPDDGEFIVEWTFALPERISA